MLPGTASGPRSAVTGAVTCRSSCSSRSTGGIGMGSIAAARRTQASFSVFLASTNPSDLQLTEVYGPNLTGDLARLAGVEAVEAANVGLTVFQLAPSGAPIITRDALLGESQPVGSINGEYFDQDRVTVTQGRMADPARENEFVATAEMERLHGWQVGGTFPMGFYTNAQSALPDFGTAKVRPRLRLEMHLVGTVVFNNEVVLDDVDRYPTYALFTPAVTDLFWRTHSTRPTASSSVTARRASRPSNARSSRLFRRGTTYNFHVTSIVEGQVNRTVKPEAIALGVFGAIALLAAFVDRDADDRPAAPGQGGGPRGARARSARAVRMAVGDGLLGILAAVVLGSLLAVAVAVGLLAALAARPGASGISHPGRRPRLRGARSRAPRADLRDRRCRRSPSPTGRRQVGRRQKVRRGQPWTSGVARLAADAGAPASATAGVRFALEPGRGRTAVPVRSALFGTALAVLIVAATLTFGSGLDTLVSHPALYGWNWTYALSSNYLVPPQSRSCSTRTPTLRRGPA